MEEDDKDVRGILDNKDNFFKESEDTDSHGK